MNSVFDNFDDLSGWDISEGSTISLNSIKEFVAGDLENSVLLRFSGKDSYAEKTYDSAIDLTGYTEILIWVWSRNKRRNGYRNPKSDFSYSISFNDTEEFYLPIRESFFYAVFDCSQISSLEKIKIKALTDNEDHIIISYGVLSKDEFPIDVFTGIKEKIEIEISKTIQEKYLIGEFTAESDSDRIRIAKDSPWIDRHSTILLKDETNSEIHSVSERKEGEFFFAKTYDGKFLKNDYEEGLVYLHFPVVFGRRQTEIELPSITLWGLEPELVPLANQMDAINDSHRVSDETVMERREGHFIKHTILIDCEARQDELLAELTTVIRRVIGSTYFYCNGKKLALSFFGGAKEIDSTESFQIIPKVQYTVDVIIQEEVYEKEKLNSTKAIQASVEIGG